MDKVMTTNKVSIQKEEEFKPSLKTRRNQDEINEMKGIQNLLKILHLYLNLFKMF